jgi:hypothetical protein
MTIWTQGKKYSPFMLIGGYLLVYANKGWNYVISDIQNLTIEKLMAKWQNFAVAAGAIILVQLLTKAKMPVAVKAFLMVLLYTIAGYQIGLAIDPPRYEAGNTASGAPVYNRYAKRT